MRTFIQKLLTNYALAILAISVVNGSVFGFDNYMPFRENLELLAVILIVRLVILATNKFQSCWPGFDYLLEFGMVLAVVLVCGWFLGWYGAESAVFMVIIISVVYIGIYAVGFGRTKRDAAFINEQIRQRRMRLAEKQKEREES